MGARQPRSHLAGRGRRHLARRGGCADRLARARPTQNRLRVLGVSRRRDRPRRGRPGRCEASARSTVNTAERLEAIEEIKQLKARYFRCMDTKDWDGFTSVFAPDARMDVTGEFSGGGADGRGVTTGNREPEGSPITTMHGYGHYREAYEKVDGRWLIASTTLTRLRT